ncbi:MAG: OsmC family protein [Acidobacteriota bacterium]|nr:OsmC family protein [Acidobacteriota bacterium]MDH3524099.1 OsmC family protein [Acidobacteriota bacterium]
MIVEITGRYTGGLGTLMIHGPSGATIRTAAPLDNHGDGSTFSPTDLAAAAFASCMVTIMGIAARDADIDLEGLTFSVEKHMAASPRRIARLPVTINMPPGLAAEERDLLETAARGCPMCSSLAAELERPVRFAYPD